MRDEEHVHAGTLAEKLGMSLSGVFCMIRNMRWDGIGVHTTHKGYILSEFAKKPDDVNFMRRLNGRRTSDYMALRAAEPEMRKRWTSVEDKNSFRLITAPLNVEIKTLNNGGRLLLDLHKKLEVKPK
jgi:biotin operon repressor